MLESMKLALRITTDDFNDQIQDGIDYVKKELHTLGVQFYSIDDARIKRLVELHLKEVFNYENKGDWYAKKYQDLMNQITLQEDYIS